MTASGLLIMSKTSENILLPATAGVRCPASQMLERFLFTPEMQYAPIGKLSGGEKRRLYLPGVYVRISMSFC